MKSKIHNYLIAVLLITVLVSYGCAHYPVNEAITTSNPELGMDTELDEMAILLTFSGGGTRAAAFSYGVLEELADTKIQVRGREKRLLDEVSMISSVSGGSFTAAYYGLFGDRIFQDFETKFLKKNVQGRLLRQMFVNPYNWVRLASPYFDRSDLAAEYFDKHLFERGTFGDMVNRRGPAILINATDMTSGLRMDFTKKIFDVMCSDLLKFPVARAVAASSAVPGIMTPITLRNYAGTCEFKPPDHIETMLNTENISDRRSLLVRSAIPYLDSHKKKYVHLLDGGIADNLGLRALIDRITFAGSVGESIKGTPLEHVNKFVFIIVNAETEPDSLLDRMESVPPFSVMIESSSTIVIQRYNVETIALLKESIKEWTDHVRALRCPDGRSTDEHSCADIQFYVINVNFNALRDDNERRYLNKISTSFRLKPEEVDTLRTAARRILRESTEFERLLNDYRREDGKSPNGIQSLNADDGDAGTARAYIK